jgi:hypothetical protein
MDENIKEIRGVGKFDNLPIKEFSLSMLREGDLPALVFIAKRGSGKSWVVRSIIIYFSDIPVGLIIAPTDRMNKFYGNWFPDTFIYYEYKSETIEKVLERQELIIEKSKQQRKKKIDTRCIIVMDDCLSTKGTWVRDEPIQKLLFDGRHYHIMYMLTMQYPLGVTPELRNNFDYVFLLATDFVNIQKKIFDHYAGMFNKFNEFREVFLQLTANYGTMVIKNKGAAANLVDKIFYYKAPNIDLNNVAIGCNQFRNYHKDNYDKDWKNRNKEYGFDSKSYFDRKKQGKEKITVQKIRNTYDEYNRSNL